VRTIGRILERRGALNGRRRIRRPSPAPGWHLPEGSSQAQELESFDFIEGLKIEDGPIIDILTSIGLRDRLVWAWPEERFSSKKIIDLLIQHWREVGVPRFAQFDNDTRFQGPHHFKDVIGRVSRLCLSLGVTPVFAPPRERGIQNDIESFNSRVQAKVWRRFHHKSLKELRSRLGQYYAACNARTLRKCNRPNFRRKFPSRWSLDLQKRPSGRLIYFRRTGDQSQVKLLGWEIEMSVSWPHRLVRCSVDLDESVIHFQGLRRSSPGEILDLGCLEHEIPWNPFEE
jgi:hypothetical protein